MAAKRDNIAFSDSIFAEDIGKFPDLNLAEALQRIPGVQIARDFTGEGTSVAVRGLGRDFTQITLNGAPVETASDSNVDSVSSGTWHRSRAVPHGTVPSVDGEQDPDRRVSRKARLPRTSICVSRARSMRKGSTSTTAPRAATRNRLKTGARASASTRATPGKRASANSAFSVALPIRVASTAPMASTPSASRRFRSATAALFATDPQCNSFVTPNNQTGYGNQAQAWPTTVPAGYNFGANGAMTATRDRDPLTVCGAGDTPGGTSGLSCRDLSFAIWPRLARPDMLIGERETTAAILTMQWAPNDKLEFYHRQPVLGSRPSVRAQRPQPRGSQHQHQRSGQRRAQRRQHRDAARRSRTRSGSTRTGRITRTRISSISTAA